MSVSLTPSGGSAVSATPIGGTLKYGDGHDDKGGGTVPNVRAGVARNGSFEVLIDSVSLTVASAIALRSGKGEGDVDIAGDDIPENMHSYDALVDVEISGDAVQIAKVSWKGTIAPAAGAARRKKTTVSASESPAGTARVDAPPSAGIGKSGGATETPSVVRTADTLPPQNKEL